MVYHTIFLCQGIHGWQFSLAKIVPCDPKSGHSSPEGPWEDRQGVEKVIIDNLVRKFEQHIRHKTQNDVGQGDSGEYLFPKTHGGDSMSGIRLRQEKTALAGHRNQGLAIDFEASFTSRPICPDCDRGKAMWIPHTIDEEGVEWMNAQHTDARQNP